MQSPRPPLAGQGFGIALLVLAFGALLRLREYLARGSLSMDESMLSLSIATRSVGELLRPLLFDQTAPVGFLWAQALMVRLGGVNELSLRLVPLLAGIATLVLVWATAIRILDRRAALLATAMAAVSPFMIRYSNEAKPYGVDALVTAGLLFLTLRVLERPGDSRRWQYLSAGGVLALLGSSPSVLVLPAVALCLLVDPNVRTVPGYVGRSIRTVLPWAVVFPILYFAVLRSETTNLFLRSYWEHSFLDPTRAGVLRDAASAIGESLLFVFLGTGGSWRVDVALVLLIPIVLGWWHLGKSFGWSRAVLFGMPSAAALGASMARIYPIGSRLSLFLAPTLVLSFAAGVYRIARARGARHATVVFVTASLVVLVLPVRYCLERFVKPTPQEDIRSLVELIDRRGAGEPIYVFSRSVPGWLMYATDWREPDVNRILEIARLVGSSGPFFRMASSRNKPVDHEGWDLRFAYGGGDVLLGIPTGQAIGFGAGWREETDSGWAANEAARLRAASDSTAWVLLTWYLPKARSGLEEALRTIGGVGTVTAETNRAVLYRYRFEPRPAAEYSTRP